MNKIALLSSLQDDVWHDQAAHDAFESWHFDALSDDGQEAVTVTFYDNYPFSPRYVTHAAREKRVRSEVPKRFPAVSFTYSCEGKVRMCAVNEFSQDNFSASKTEPICRIAGSSFHAEAADYGSGFVVKLDLVTSKQRRIKAELEWVTIEKDLAQASPPEGPTTAHSWNIAAPRSDVSGRMELIRHSGGVEKTVHFRGTGYHDQFRSECSLTRTMWQRCWGRAHYVDSTVLFQHLTSSSSTDSYASLIVIRDGSIDEHEAKCIIGKTFRDRFGLLVPRRMSITCPAGAELRIETLETVRSGFFQVKMLGEMTLKFGDGPAKKTTGILELIAPGRLRNPAARWFSDLGIAKNGKPPLF
ncbi:MAG: hypothetical protein ABR530_09910 [Pyrinomonadaceae bacterium]